MDLEPLTPVAVESLVSELNILKEADLQIVAEAINKDFKKWLSDHFILTAKELRFLNGIDESAMRYFAAQCAFCVQHYIDIILFYPPPPAEPGFTTWLFVRSSIVSNVNARGEVETFGSLVFEVRYEFPMFP